MVQASSGRRGSSAGLTAEIRRPATRSAAAKLVRRSPPPRELRGVDGHSRRVCLADAEQLAAKKPADGGLRRTAREAGVLRELDIADGDRFFAAALLAHQPEINEKRGGLTVVTRQVAQQRVEDVVVNGDRWLHRYTDKEYSDNWAIVRTRMAALLFLAGGERMIRGIKFVSVPVKDQDKALAFWTEKCGFKVGTDQ